METPAASPNLTQQDERVMAALAHIAVLLPMIGLIAAIVIWITQKDRSRFVAFQALQAIVFQLLLIVVWIGGMACYMASFFLTFFGTIAFASFGSNGPPVGFLIPVAVIFGMIGLMGIFIIYGIVAAVLTFQGKDFRYPLIGRWVERYNQHAPVA